jgi:hypothetical protein
MSDLFLKPNSVASVTHSNADSRGRTASRLIGYTLQYENLKEARYLKIGAKPSITSLFANVRKFLELFKPTPNCTAKITTVHISVKVSYIKDISGNIRVSPSRSSNNIIHSLTQPTIYQSPASPCSSNPPFFLASSPPASRCPHPTPKSSRSLRVPHTRHP